MKVSIYFIAILMALSIAPAALADISIADFGYSSVTGQNETVSYTFDHWLVSGSSDLDQPKTDPGGAPYIERAFKYDEKVIGEERLFEVSGGFVDKHALIIDEDVFSDQNAHDAGKSDSGIINLELNSDITFDSSFESGWYYLGLRGSIQSTSSESDYFSGIITDNSNNSNTKLIWSNHSPGNSGAYLDSNGPFLTNNGFYFSNNESYNLLLQLQYDGYENNGFTNISLYEVFLSKVPDPLPPDPTVPAPSALLLTGLGTACVGRLRRMR